MVAFVMGAYHGIDAAQGLATLTALAAEHEEIRRALSDDAYRIPRGWYRAHRAIAAGACAHCDRRFRPGQTIGYNSILPGRHKTLCGACFTGAYTGGDGRRDPDGPGPPGLPTMTPGERCETWLALYRGVVENMRPGDRSRPTWRSGQQLAWARGEAHRQLAEVERELARGAGCPYRAKGK